MRPTASGPTERVASTSAPWRWSRSPVLDARTGHIVDRLTQDEGYGCADDVTMGPDGSLYWTDIFEGQVGRRRAGRYRHAAGRRTRHEPDHVQRGREALRRPVVHARGRRALRVAPAFSPGHPPRLVWDPGDGYPYLQQLNGFDFGPDGLLYAPQPYLGRVVRLDRRRRDRDAAGRRLRALHADGGQVRLEGPPVRGDGRRDRARRRRRRHHGPGGRHPTTGLDNLAFDQADRLYCTGGGDGALYRICLRANRVWSRPGIGTPGGVAVVPGSHRRQAAALYVADVLRPGAL